MDCVRVSTKERDGLRFIGKYVPVKNIDSSDDCRSFCVSDLDCKAWSYRLLDFRDVGTTVFHKNKGECLISDTLKKGDVAVEPFPKTKSGLVVCKNFPNYPYILMWVGICAVILFVVWYMLNIVKPYKIKMGEDFFPEFYMRGPK